MAIRLMEQVLMLKLLAISAGSGRIKLCTTMLENSGSHSSKFFLIGFIIVVQFLC